MFSRINFDKRTPLIIVTVSFLALGFCVFAISLNNEVELQELVPLKPKTITKEKKTNQISTASSFLKVTENIKVKQKNLVFEVITQEGDQLLVLVNKKIGLPSNFVPSGLDSLEGLVNSSRNSKLKKEAAVALKEMFSSAKIEKGIDFSVVSAYRSYEEQVKVFNGWVSSAGLISAESFSARPGHSQHQLGTTVDIGIAGMASFTEQFGSSLEGIWLEQNSYKFGYVLSYPKDKEKITGYNYEPWHYRYIGKENAQRMLNYQLILEEFLQKYGTW